MTAPQADGGNASLDRIRERVRNMTETERADVLAYARRIERQLADDHVVWADPNNPTETEIDAFMDEVLGGLRAQAEQLPAWPPV